MIIEYFIVSSSGNVTALVTTPTEKNDYKKISTALFKTHSEVEQIGFLKNDGDMLTLNMSGGEFCGNAILSAVALISDLTGKTGEYTVKISGCDSLIKAKSEINNGEYHCVCEVPFSKNSRTFSAVVNGKEVLLPVIELDGIAHIIAPLDFDKEDAEKLIKSFAEKQNYKALGIMFYGSSTQKVTPLVYVADVDTLFYEKSCASGSCAVCCYEVLKQNKAVSLKLNEPGGTICVSADTNKKFVALSNKILIEKHFKNEIK